MIGFLNGSAELKETEPLEVGEATIVFMDMKLPLGSGPPAAFCGVPSLD